MKLSSALNGPNLKPDLVLIEEADWSLKYRIAREGKVLFEKDDA